MGATAYNKKRLKDRNIPPITLDAANIIGDKKSILIKDTVKLNLSGSIFRPGAKMPMIDGAKIIKATEMTAVDISKKFRIPFTKSHPFLISFLSR